MAEININMHSLEKLVMFGLCFLLLPHCDLLCFLSPSHTSYLFEIAFLPFSFRVLYKKGRKRCGTGLFNVANRIQTLVACVSTKLNGIRTCRPPL